MTTCPHHFYYCLLDPHGNAGLYIRHPPASHVSEPRDENYANELRNKTKSLQKAPANNIQRVRFQ